jgi:hypothetical protein
MHALLSPAPDRGSLDPMPTRSSKLDLSQLAKRIVDEATGDEPKTEPPPVKNEAAVALGKLGGKKGGAARAAALTPEQRSEIAKKAAAKRWAKR